MFIELISFGDMVKLYKYDIERYPGCLKYSELLYSIRDLRNATAHSNCLINKLQNGVNKPSVKSVKFISNIDEIGTSMRTNKLSNKFLYDFISLLYFLMNLLMQTLLRKKDLNRYRNL